MRARENLDLTQTSGNSALPSPGSQIIFRIKKGDPVP